MERTVVKAEAVEQIMQNKDLRFLQLWDLYGVLLTENQREITNLYFNCDLSLGEIAEQKGVSRQSVSDCLRKCRKQLETYDKKLGFVKALTDLSREYSAYMTTVLNWLNELKAKNPDLTKEVSALQNALSEVHKEFGAEETPVENGVIVGKVIRDEE